MSRFTVGATLSLILLLTLSSVPGVMADGPGGTWTSWPFIQNPGTETANVVVQFYDVDGNEIVAAQRANSIPGGESWYVPVWSISELGTSFTGSMVVSSNVSVIAVSNQVNEYSAGNSYSGAEHGATSLFAPSIHANDWGWWAEIFVQNTTADDATVQVSFVPSNYGNAYTTPEVTIPAYSSKGFSTEDYASQLGQFVGAATITCTNGKEIVGVVEEWNTGAGYLTIAHNTIPSGEGGYNVYFPSQHNNNWGWYAYNFVQNPSSTDADVVVRFSGQSPVNRTVPANGSLVIATWEYLGTLDYVGSLEVECTNCEANGIKLTGITNEINTEGGNNYAISYNASYQGNTKVSFPSQHNNNWGWFSYNFLQNLSSDTANIRVTWSGTGPPAAWDTTIPGDGSIYIATGDYMGWAGTDFVGSLTVESTNGKPIIGICNEVQGTAAGVDAAISYNSFGQ